MGLPSEPFALSRLYYRTPDGRTMELLQWWAGFGSSGDPPTDVLAFVGGWAGTIAGPLKDCLTATTTFLGHVVSFHQDGVVWTDDSSDAAGTGNEVSDELPEFCACCIQKKTVFPGRSGSGRWFIGGVPESFTDEGRLTPGGLATYLVLGTALAAPSGIGACDLYPAVYSPKNSDLYNIAHINVDKVLARQSRRRLRSPV